MKSMWIVAAALVMGAAVGCGGKACPQLAKEACEMAPDSVACESASRLTANDECAGYLKDVAKYVELKNTKITEPGVQPPAPTAPEPATEAPAEATGEEAPAEPPAEAPAEAPAAN